MSNPEKDRRRNQRKAKATLRRVAASDGYQFTIIGACCVVEVELYATGRQQVRHDDGCPVLTDKGSPESIRARLGISQAVCSEAERLGHGDTMGVVETTPGNWVAVGSAGIIGPVDLPASV
jgi:hypothetical protein